MDFANLHLLKLQAIEFQNRNLNRQKFKTIYKSFDANACVLIRKIMMLS